MDEPSHLEQLIPTKLARWALAAILTSPAPGYFLADTLTSLLPNADKLHKLLLWAAITFFLMFAAACVVALDLALLLKHKKHGTIWHYKAGIR